MPYPPWMYLPNLDSLAVSTTAWSGLEPTLAHYNEPSLSSSRPAATQGINWEISTLRIVLEASYRTSRSKFSVGTRSFYSYLIIFLPDLSNTHVAALMLAGGAKLSDGMFRPIILRHVAKS